MAYATCDASLLRDAILCVWAPAVGARSFSELTEKNVHKVLATHGVNTYQVLDNIPIVDTGPEFVLQRYFDDQPPFEIGEAILSGSWSEGLFLYGHSSIDIPDMDYMVDLKHISFSEEDQKSGNLTLKEDTPFVYAYITDERAVKLWNDFLVDEKHPPRRRLSSEKLKEKLRQNSRKERFNVVDDDNLEDIGEGAAMYISKADIFSRVLNLVNVEVVEQFSPKMGKVLAVVKKSRKEYHQIFTGFDVVLSISCDGWPHCARDWMTRDRVWPGDDLVQKITQDGFHIVPKSSAEGDFRLSFSFAEIALIENLTELQHKVLRSFKAVVKYYQNTWSPNIKEFITTYHLKTIAFWHFEKTAQNSFTKETVVTHLVLLLQELAEALRKRELPMYFMPKVNLVKSIESPEEAIDIAEKIVHLSQDFPLIIKAIENISTGFSRVFGYQTNMMGCLLDFMSKLMDISKKEGEVNSARQAKEKLPGLVNGMKNAFKLMNKLPKLEATCRLPDTEPDQL